MRRLGAVLALIAAAALVAAVATSGAALTKKTEKVNVGDYYFAPDNVKIRKGNRVKWIWDKTVGGEDHDVYLTEAPKGVKKRKFRSAASNVPGFTFAKRFEKRGLYHFVCTFHQGLMQMDVKVRR